MNVPTETIPLNEKSFKTAITLENPGTQQTYSFTCVVDTGNPDAIALPEQHSSKFNRKIGYRTRGGAGKGKSEAYAVEIATIGNTQVSHVTIAVMSLPSRYSHGLLGIELFKYLIIEIYDDPDSKKMDIEMKYL